MARAFTDVVEIEALADQLAQWGEDGEKACRRAVSMTAIEVQAEQIVHVPVDSGETRDSIRIKYRDEGLSASIGPTNRDSKGAPVGFFIEFGRGGQEPHPFVRPSVKYAQGALSGRISDELARMFTT